MKKLVVANWKDHLAPSEALAWLETFRRGYRPLAVAEVVLAVPFLVMREAGTLLEETAGVSLAAQAVSPFPPGGYTGATPARWLRGLADRVLVGHRERRHYFHEDEQSVAAQVRESLAVGLQPILCTDRSEAPRQLAALDHDELDRVLLAYTPANAVDLEIAAPTQDIAAVVSTLGEMSGGRPVLYGGGVNESNAAALLAMDGMAGIMVGRGCLDATEFLRLLERLA